MTRPPHVRRWLRPGGAALYGLLAAALAAAVLQPIRSYDLWWHLATGRLFWSGEEIPRTDPFSFTCPGRAWLDHEWLFQAVAFPIFRLGGWPALLALELLLVIAAYVMLARILRRQGILDGLVCLVLLLSASGARSRFDPRPEIASLCLAPILCAVLSRSREPSSRRWCLVLPPLFLFWGNLHPGVVLGAVLLYLWMAGEWIQSRISGRREGTHWPRALMVLSSPIFLLVNPGGWRLLAVPFELRRIITSGHAPNLEWAPPAFQDFPFLYLAASFGVLVVLLGIRRADLPATLVAGTAGALAFLHLRNVGFFFVLLPLAITAPLARVVEKMRISEAALRALCASALVLVTILFVGENRQSGRHGYLAQVAPERAVDFIERNRIGRRLFNDVKFGGYLIWRRYPSARVFIDGRNEVYEPLLKEVFSALGSWGEWESMLQRYRIDAAMLRRGQVQAVEYPPAKPGSPGRRELRAFSSAYFQSGRWALVYWDDQALVFVRRDDPAAAALLPAEYRFVNPDDIPQLLARMQRGEVDRRAVLLEIDRKLAEDSGCLTAQRLRALFAPPA